MLRDDRLMSIIKRLEREGRVVAADLADELDVPVDMVRRDLRDLAGRGRCRRVYGGAVRSAAANPHDVQALTGSALAVAAARAIGEGQVVFLDAGRTGQAVARALDSGTRATIVTACPRIATALLPHTGIEVIIVGGRLDRSTGAALGAIALDALRNLRFDLCLLGACAVAAEGVSAFDAEDAAMKRHLIAASAAVMVAATADKVGTRAPFHVIALEHLDRLVVEGGAPAAELDRMREAGLEIEEIEARA